MARPKKQLSEKTIEKLAAMNCSVHEIASALDVSPDTLQRRYAAAIRKGREHGKYSLKKAMFDKAIKDKNTMMQIWLSKNMLWYSDKVETTNEVKTFVVKGSDDKEIVTVITEDDLYIRKKRVKDETGTS